MPAVPQGLCASCVHRREVRTGRGSTFALCGLSRTDPDFPKYPRLPVLSCRGWQPHAAEPPAEGDAPRDPGPRGRP